MASFKITDLTELAAVDVADADLLEIVDFDADQSKKVSIQSLKTVFTASPAGSDTQIQFNDGGSFGASSLLSFSASNRYLYIGSTSGGSSTGISFRRPSGGYELGRITGGNSALSWNMSYPMTIQGAFLGLGVQAVPEAQLHTRLEGNDIGYRLDLSNGQTSDAFQINSYGNTGGDLFNISASGNVGIGTSSPNQALHVLGNIRVGSDGNNSIIYLTGATDGNWYIQTGLSAGIGSYGTRFSQHSSGDANRGWTFYDDADNVNRAWIKSLTGDAYFSGNLGLGTETISASLHQVLSTDQVGHRLDLSNGQTEDAFQINTSGSTGGDVFRIGASGSLSLNDSGLLYDDTIGKLSIGKVGQNGHIGLRRDSNAFEVGSLYVTQTSLHIRENQGSGGLLSTYDNQIALHWRRHGSFDNRVQINPSSGIAFDATFQVNLRADTVGQIIYGSNGQSEDYFRAVDYLDNTRFSLNSVGAVTITPDIGYTSEDVITISNNLNELFSIQGYGVARLNGVTPTLYFGNDYSNYINNGGQYLTSNQGTGNTFYTIRHNNGSNAIRIKSNSDVLLQETGTGNVGIGTTSPSAKLHTNLTTDQVGYRLDLSNGQTSDAFQINSYGNTGGDLFRITNSGRIRTNGNIILEHANAIIEFSDASAKGIYSPAYNTGVANTMVFKNWAGSTRLSFDFSTANNIVNIGSLPTSSAGLSAGDLWNDSGTVKIV